NTSYTHQGEMIAWGVSQNSKGHSSETIRDPSLILASLESASNVLYYSTLSLFNLKQNTSYTHQ
ncbi:hypothetical protein ABEB36_015827, partial [Hypothenemus hampei]